MGRKQKVLKFKGIYPGLGGGPLILVLMGMSALSLPAQDAQPPTFESDVLPIFQRHCLQCHSAEVHQGGLSLETLDQVLRGGDSGPVVVANKPPDSLLLTMITSGSMPMGGSPLAAGAIEVVRRWIEAGMPGETLEPVVPPAAAPVHEREVMAAILGAKCLPCHGRRRQEAGLDLRTREGLLKGGESGPAIVPGRPEESLLVQRILAQEMPPPKLQEQFSVRGLTSNELETLQAWIAAGALPDAESPLEIAADNDPLVSSGDRRFWSFQPPRRPAQPRVGGKEHVRNPVDAFLLARLEQKGLSFSPQADRLTLMRRSYFDLVGLPPSPEEIEAFLADSSPRAYESLVDRLLESPHYGERWARYWLDAVGYADSEGGVSSDNVRPHAFRYRDYVIRSLNADKPYDRFLIEQIAGDELFDYKAFDRYTPDQLERLVATGFLRMGPDSTYSTEQNNLPERLDVLATQVEILSSSTMGLTLGCARCHDHKYDPLPQRDYYRLSAILRTAYDPYDWLSPSMGCIGVGARCDESNTRLLPLPSASELREVEEYNAPFQRKIAELERALGEKARPLRKKLIEEKLAALPQSLREDLKAASSVKPEDQTQVQQYLLTKFKDALQATRAELVSKFEDFAEAAKENEEQIKTEKGKLKAKPMIRALFDMGGRPTPTRILGRGEYTNAGVLVLPGVPAVLNGDLEPYRVEKLHWSTETTGRRLALAKWLTQPNHPLTARVIVNRLWQHHFGVGLVSTPGNFGSTGARPSHPKLLDWLSREFVERGWSIKALHRLIMTSTAYRQKSSATRQAQELDPDNRLWSRFPLRRLDADALRDSILKVAGRLDPTPYGPADELEIKPDGEVVAKAGPKGYRRSIFLMQRRSKPVTLLESFDAPLLVPNCLKRPHSTVSSQALQLENSELVRISARHMAGRVIDAVGDDLRKQIERVYLLTLARPPSRQEVMKAEEILRQLTQEWKRHLEVEVPAEPVASQAQWLALASLCHTYLNSAEFLYVN